MGSYYTDPIQTQALKVVATRKPFLVLLQACSGRRFGPLLIMQRTSLVWAKHLNAFLKTASSCPHSPYTLDWILSATNTPHSFQWLPVTSAHAGRAIPPFHESPT